MHPSQQWNGVCTVNCQHSFRVFPSLKIESTIFTGDWIPRRFRTIHFLIVTPRTLSIRLWTSRGRVVWMALISRPLDPGIPRYLPEEQVLATALGRHVDMLFSDVGTTNMFCHRPIWHQVSFWAMHISHAEIVAARCVFRSAALDTSHTHSHAPYTRAWYRLSKELCFSESLENKVASMSRTILRLVERHKELQAEVRHYL